MRKNGSINVISMSYRYVVSLIPILCVVIKVSEERISNIRTVRAFGRESYEINRYNDRIEQVLQVSYSESFARACFYGLTGKLLPCILLFILF